ncbi:conserved protein of unknown function [Candidatus Hydrogenisulfobacillus filiaventi]|uniref:DUF2249 domain-containing protein n=1 Tax=Candidatus Hydrogenisulfobacillus filiaventi TaxID=2707344 RepID=A0A6F8ZCX6_9FIRM|nr:DUF2249 domain-containing protein [Bacillota bacterium]CAB1127728.1 conserved protein of unknown function [Candidatus Hydrogenisulfobacillus filiaventi]
MTVLDLRGLPAAERRPRIAEAVAGMAPGDSAVLVIEHEDFWGAIPKTIEGFAGQVRFDSITFEQNYRVYDVRVTKL